MQTMMHVVCSCDGTEERKIHYESLVVHACLKVMYLKNLYRLILGIVEWNH